MSHLGTPAYRPSAQEPESPSPADVRQCLHTPMWVHTAQSGRVSSSQDGSSGPSVCCPASRMGPAALTLLHPSTHLYLRRGKQPSPAQEVPNLSHSSLEERQSSVNKTEAEIQRQTTPRHSTRATIRGTVRHTAKTLPPTRDRAPKKEPIHRTTGTGWEWHQAHEQVVPNILSIFLPILRENETTEQNKGQ